MDKNGSKNEKLTLLATLYTPCYTLSLYTYNTDTLLKHLAPEIGEMRPSIKISLFLVCFLAGFRMSLPFYYGFG